MPSAFKSRLGRLESKFNPPAKPHRIVRMVASDEEEAKAKAALEVEGFDPEGDDVLIIRLVALPGPNGPVPAKAPARVPSVSGRST